MSRLTPFPFILVLSLAAACGSSPTQPTPAAFRVEQLNGMHHVLAETGVTYYRVLTTIVAAQAISGTVDLSITFTGGAAPPLTRHEAHAVSIPAGAARGFEVVIPDPATGTAPHSTVEVVFTLEGTGQRAQASGSSPVRDFTAPELTAWIEKTTLAAGETTGLHWRASGSTAVSMRPSVTDLLVPPEGVVEITPCPGTTVFDLGVQNPSGAVNVQVAVTVGPPPVTPWICGVWSGPASERWTDANGTPGSWSGGVTLSLFQSGGQVFGYFVRGLPLNGLLVRPVDARAGPSSGGFAATVPAQPQGFPRESGPRFACPIELEARLTPDGAVIAGSFRARCRPDGGGEITLTGQFDARFERSYPWRYQGP